MRLPALLCLLPLAAGCNTPTAPAGAPSPPLPGTAAVVVADPAATTELVPGQLLRIELEGNPSTGYRWDVDGELPPQLEAVDGLADGPAMDPAGPPRVGAPRPQWLHFRAVAPGQAELRLRWHRPWETGNAPARSARYLLRVR